MAPVLPKYIIIRSNYFASRVFICHDGLDGIPNSVAFDDGDSLFSEQAKIEVEHSKTHSKYVHLRFCFNNRYMSRRNSPGGFVVADSGKPEEDMTKPSCTLFEPVVADSAGNYNLIHVNIGWRARYSWTFEWGETEGKTVKVSAKGVVRVPARSKALVYYVGTMGTCGVPFSYTQKDRSATDGRIVYSNFTDGIFTGVNCYNFQFIIHKTTPL